MSTLEQCFVGGHTDKLSQFCEACGIGHCGGLKGDHSRIVDSHKVLCLCAISDSVLFEQECLDALTVDNFLYAKCPEVCPYCFYKGAPLLD